MDEKILKFFAEYIESELGIVYNEVNYNGLSKRLEEIKEILQLPSIQHLFEFCQESGIKGHTKQLVLDMATNNETLFFRDKKAFTLLREVLIPEFLEKNNHKVSIRSAACSFGQEPYTLAMVTSEIAESAEIHADIDASDISQRALDYAKMGRYSQLEVQRGLSSKLLIKYFHKNDSDYWEINQDIKNRVRFFERNLLDLDREIKRYDIILCRYVLIYQSIERKKKIIKFLHQRLQPGGVLILGGSESLIGLSQDFTHEKINEAVFYRKKDAA